MAPAEPKPSRLVPHRRLPPYAFSGDGHGFPHPRRDAAGHSHSEPEAPIERLEPERWAGCEAYCYGIDLFHLGYYWEAHEAWEALWVEEPGRSPLAFLLKGLIQLAAAGVKVRQGRHAGVARLGASARRHFVMVRAATGRAVYAGLRLEELIAFASDVSCRPERWPRHEGEAAAVVFDRRLPLEE